MHIVRRDDAPPYSAPGHFGMAMRRLQGREAGPSESVWLGLSVVAPGGGTTLTASDVEKFYVLIEGELEVTGKAGETEQVALLQPRDSCRIAPGEARQLFNRGPVPAAVLLVMPNT
jgi:mannose-6-phosphate isomerase-like protein (cupin superfamily)